MDSEQTSIIVEFSSPEGIDEVSWRGVSKDELIQKSDIALIRAMNAIEEMAQKVSGLGDKIPVEFSEVDIEFGIKLGFEAGVVLSKASTEANLNVTLKWKRPEP